MSSIESLFKRKRIRNDVDYRLHARKEMDMLYAVSSPSRDVTDDHAPNSKHGLCVLCVAMASVCDNFSVTGTVLQPPTVVLVHIPGTVAQVVPVVPTLQVPVHTF